MAVTLRSGLNRQMTHREMDENFTVLRSLAPPITVDSSGTEYTNSNRGRWKSTISAAPSSLGNHDSIGTAFSGDISKVQLPVEHRITGTATLGQPTSGYTYTPEAYAHYTYLYNESGWNNGTSDNTGRTAAVAYRTKVYQNGQGDCVAFNASAFVTGARSGATSFLANPAASLFNGDMTAGADGVYLNPIEIALNGNGKDVAGIGAVFNLNRDVITGALGVAWNGVRVQSTGSQKIDSGYFISGSARVGLDLSHATLDAAITMKQDQYIYFNVTTDGNTLKRYPTLTDYYHGWDSASTIYKFVVNNSSVFSMSSSQVNVSSSNGISVSGTGVYRMSGTQVVGTRKTGWTAWTGSTSRASFDTSTATLANVAQTMKALLDDLTNHGLIGT